MKVGRGMVTYLGDELVAEGAIYEGAAVSPPRGRKPKMLYVRTRDRLVVAVDVRFSRTYLMLSDFGGTPIALEQFETLTDPQALVAELAERIERVLATHGAVGRCEGVGWGGELLVQTASGMKTITSAEVSVRPAPST